VFIIKNIYFRQRNCAQELQSRDTSNTGHKQHWTQDTEQTTLDTRHRTNTHKTSNTGHKTQNKDTQNKQHNLEN
jgi:hypothetical protein